MEISPALHISAAPPRLGGCPAFHREHQSAVLGEAAGLARSRGSSEHTQSSGVLLQPLHTRCATQNPSLRAAGTAGPQQHIPALLTSTPSPPLILLTQNQGRRRGSVEVREKHIFGNSKASFSSNTPATTKKSFRQILYL